MLDDPKLAEIKASIFSKNKKVIYQSQLSTRNKIQIYAVLHKFGVSVGFETWIFTASSKTKLQIFELCIFGRILRIS